MQRDKVDELYHNLRLLNLSESTTEKEAILGITAHLTAPGGDYIGLLRYLSWYGENFLLNDVNLLLNNRGAQFDRVVDFGAGFGWLGRGISNAHDALPTLFVDKREWTLIDIVADLESSEGRKRIYDALKPGDLIVMSELLHCLDDPQAVLDPFRFWPMLIIEYAAWSNTYMDSYRRQISKLGCKPIGNIGDIFPRRAINFRVVGTYKIWYISPTPRK